MKLRVFLFVSLILSAFSCIGQIDTATTEGYCSKYLAQMEIAEFEKSLCQLSTAEKMKVGFVTLDSARLRSPYVVLYLSVLSQNLPTDMDIRKKAIENIALLKDADLLKKNWSFSLGLILLCCHYRQRHLHSLQFFK